MTGQTTIVCPHCKQEFPLTDALSHEYELKAEAKIRSEVELAMKDKTNEAEELRKQNKDLQTQLLELNKTIRQLQRSFEEKDLEMQKKLAGEEEKIRQEAKIKSEEEHKLKEAEKDKLINDLKKDLDETKRRLEQGSQQTQGEVLELEIEKLLKTEFPSDHISEIKKGVHGADILQEVIDRNGRSCGKILWESKNAQWSDQWLGKLREDQREAKAGLAALVSKNLPANINSFIFRSGVWLSSVTSVAGLAYALRFNLIQVNQVRLASASKGETKDYLYDYVTSLQFQHRVEAMMDAYRLILDDVEKEKRWFSAKWARQEKSVRTLMEQTGAIHGELAGIVGPALPTVKNLELADGESSV